MRRISNFSNLSFRSRFTTRKQTRKRDKKKDRKRAQYINESNTSVPQARLLTRESKGNQQQSIIMASTLTCRGCRVSIGTKVIPEFMGIGILSLSSYLLWCCGVVVLCCGVVVLLACMFVNYLLGSLFGDEEANNTLESLFCAKCLKGHAKVCFNSSIPSSLYHHLINFSSVIISSILFLLHSLLWKYRSVDIIVSCAASKQITPVTFRSVPSMYNLISPISHLIYITLINAYIKNKQLCTNRR